MPTKTPQRGATAPRFSRTPAKPAGRVPRRAVAPQPRFRPKTTVRGKASKQKPSGLAGLLSSLPVGGNAAAKAAQGGKGKPAAALLLAGAGALLGGRKLADKRKAQRTPPAEAPFFPPAPPAPATNVAPVAPAPVVDEDGTLEGGSQA